MEQKHGLLEFVNMLQGDFPCLLQNGFTNTQENCSVNVFYPHPAICSYTLSPSLDGGYSIQRVQYLCGLLVIFSKKKLKKPKWSKKWKNIFIVNSSLSFKVEEDITVGDYDAIKKVFDDFLKCLKEVYPPRQIRKSNSIYGLPSLKMNFSDDWNEAVNVMRLWKDTVAD
ncbi:MAG: hypothetical protein LBI53_04890 [Candidatus Peribacteria bacterium]|jgi:hypothetical protein|nr:hypothetical protein [Candidatus Peribacteria bacterium]